MSRAWIFWKAFLWPVAEVFQTNWWMRLYGGPSPKRHVAYCNSEWVERFNNGKLRGWQKSHNKDRRNTVEYYDRSGKKVWHGSCHLKGSQPGSQNNTCVA